MLYGNDEEARIAEKSCNEADEKCRDSRDADALLENYNSSNRLGMRYDEDVNAGSCT